MIERKYVGLLLFSALVSILLASLFYSNLVQAQSTVTGYVSVPAAAFEPYCNLHGDVLIDNRLRNYDAFYQDFTGSVQLPHGATITEVTIYWYDAGDSNIRCWLNAYDWDSTLELAYIESSGNAGYGASYDDTIDHATIDNRHRAYYLHVVVPSSASHEDYHFGYAVIEYTLPSRAVGGLTIPVDKLGLLAPYIALVSTIILAVSASVAFFKYRKKQ